MMNNKKAIFPVIVFAVFVLFISSRGTAESARVAVDRSHIPRARIIVTGTGYLPKRNMTESRKRLLAQRAATVDAYRKIIRAVKGMGDYLVNGETYIRTSGYIKGAEVMEKREYVDGRVEVDVSVPVELNDKINMNTLIYKVSKEGYSAYYLDKTGNSEISKEEWMRIIKNKEGGEI